MRDKVFNCTQHLKGIKNELVDYYYVNQQYRDEHAAIRKEIQQKVKKIKEENLSLPKDKQIHFKVSNKQLLINGNPQVKQVIPPIVCEILNLDKAETDKMDKIKLSALDVIACL